MMVTPSSNVGPLLFGIAGGTVTYLWLSSWLTRKHDRVAARDHAVEVTGEVTIPDHCVSCGAAHAAVPVRGTIDLHIPQSGLPQPLRGAERPDVNDGGDGEADQADGDERRLLPFALRAQEHFPRVGGDEGHGRTGNSLHQHRR